MGADQVVTVLVALLTGGGFFALVQWLLRRRASQVDIRTVNTARVAEINASVADKSLDRMFSQMEARITGYEQSIREMQAAHARDIAEVKTENRQLERQLADLRRTLQDYQLGNRVPRGYVLLPMREIRRVREREPGLLDASWYPGEDTEEEGEPPMPVAPRRLIRGDPPVRPA